MSPIICESQDYSGLAWVRYGAAFRKPAALTGNKWWSVMKSSLFTVNFMEAEKALSRCKLREDTHIDKEYVQPLIKSTDLRVHVCAHD